MPKRRDVTFVAPLPGPKTYIVAIRRNGTLCGSTACYPLSTPTFVRVHRLHGCTLTNHTAQSLRALVTPKSTPHDGEPTSTQPLLFQFLPQEPS